MTKRSSRRQLRSAADQGLALLALWPLTAAFGADPNGQAWNSQNKPWYHPGRGPSHARRP